LNNSITYAKINAMIKSANLSLGHGLIITTNRSIDPAANALRAMLGEANWSRILKLCPKGSLVDLNGLPDRRVASSGR